MPTLMYALERIVYAFQNYHLIKNNQEKEGLKERIIKKQTVFNLLKNNIIMFFFK